MTSSSQFLKEKVAELIKLGLRTDDRQPDLEDRLFRLLRPASGDDHSTVIKLLLRQAILNKSSKATEGPAEVAKFERECEHLRRLNLSILNPFLAMLEPLKFPKLQHFYFEPTVTKPVLAITRNDPEKERRIREQSQSFLPISAPFPTNDSDAAALESGFIWLSKDVEIKVMRDLLHVFQVLNRYPVAY